MSRMNNYYLSNIEGYNKPDNNINKVKEYWCVFIQELDNEPEPYDIKYNKPDAIQCKILLAWDLKDKGLKRKVFIKQISENMARIYLD